MVSFYLVSYFFLAKNFPQIVTTLMGNKLYADKMILYAENHNQVILLSGHQSYTSNSYSDLRSFDSIDIFIALSYLLSCSVYIWRALFCRDIVW